MPKTNWKQQPDENTAIPLSSSEAANFCDQDLFIRRMWVNLPVCGSYAIKSTGQMHKVETGDIVLVKSPKIISKAIRRIIAVRYGIPYRTALSHIQLVLDAKETLSAESRGVVMIGTAGFAPGTEVLVYRLSGMTEYRKKLLRELSRQYLGKKYAYARYVLDTSNIDRFLKAVWAGVYFLVGLLLYWFIRYMSLLWIAAFLAAASALFSLLNFIWKYFDRKCYDCVEVVSELLTRTGAWIPLEKPRNEHPNGMKQVLDNLCLYKKATLLGEFTVEKK